MEEALYALEGMFFGGREGKVGGEVRIDVGHFGLRPSGFAARSPKIASNDFGRTERPCSSAGPSPKLKNRRTLRAQRFFNGGDDKTMSN